MYYGTVQGVKNNLPRLAKYIKPTPSDTLDIAESAIESVLQEYTSRVDAMLGSRYQTPLPADNAVVASIVTDLASAKVSMQFQTQLSAEENANIAAIRKDAQALLDKLASGRASLPGVPELQPPDELDGILGGEDPIFDMEDTASWQTKFKG